MMPPAYNFCSYNLLQSFAGVFSSTDRSDDDKRQLVLTPGPLDHLHPSLAH